MPVTRDNRYKYTRIPLKMESGSTTGIDVAVCKECGTLVLDTKQHTKFHRENDKD